MPSMKQISLLAATTPSSPAPGADGFDAGEGAGDRACVMEPQAILGPRTLLIRGGSNVPVANRSNAPATISARCGERQFIVATRESGRDLLNLLGGQDLLDLLDLLVV